MPETTFGFIADTHLCLKKYGSEQRGADFLHAVLNAIEQCASCGIETILHAGDLCDTAEITGTEYSMLRTVHQRLVSKKMRMLSITGNHDMNRVPWHSVVGHTLPEVSTEIEITDKHLGVLCIDNRLVKVHGRRILGVPYQTDGVMRQRLHTMATEFGLSDTSPADFLMWHGMVREFFASSNSISAAEFAAHDYFNNVLLGDIHIRQFYALRFDNRGIIGYPGSTELCSVNEPTDKTVAVLNFADETQVTPSITYLPIDTRPCWRRRIENEETMTGMLNELRAMDRNSRGPIIVASVRDDISDFKNRVVTAAPANTVVLEPRYIQKFEDISMSAHFSEPDYRPKTMDLEDMILTVFPGLDKTSANFSALLAIAQSPDAASTIIETRVQEILKN